jgi:hypothetical protein
LLIAGVRPCLLTGTVGRWAGRLRAVPAAGRGAYNF